MGWLIGIDYHFFMKKCSRCGLEKPFPDFGKDNSSPDRLLYWCKSCTKEYRILQGNKYKNLHLKYPQTAERARKAWREKNKDKQYRNNTKRRERERRNYANILNVKMRKILRERIRKAAKGLPIKIDKVGIVGCSVEELIQYIENKFSDGMNWGNWTSKGWHLDHIIPLCKFDLTKEEEIKKACHYTNLQPLWWQENLAKGFL